MAQQQKLKGECPMKNLVSQVLFKVQNVDERTVRVLFVLFSFVFMLIQNSPTDGGGGVR
jgi:hypothetical protein